MKRRLRIEIQARNNFWHKAVLIEWKDQYPQRELESDEENCFLIEEEWLEDFRRVAEQCLSKVRVAPADPGRRMLLRRLFPRIEKE